jgi:putative ABC transport system permease protein
MILTLAIKSLRNRSFTALLTVLSIALAVLLVLGVERLREQARVGFTSTISGTDLIVGARSSPVHLLLYSVFRIGNPTNNLRWESYEAIASRSDIAWTIPISLGDTYRGFRVLGTTQDYFEHFRFAKDHHLELSAGGRFEGEQDAVLGSDVARELGLHLGQSIVVAHGAGDVSFVQHEEHPFHIVGVLAATGTPVDRTVHVTLRGFDALHTESSAEAGDPLLAAIREKSSDASDAPAGASKRPISAFLIGLRSRSTALSVQRAVNEYPSEPLTAILPGPTLEELWEIVGGAERTLMVVSSLVVVVGLAGMLVALLTSLSERRREMAVLRSVGARPAQVFGLILGEAAALTLAGIALGFVALYGALIAARPWLESHVGVVVGAGWPSAREVALMVTVAAAGTLTGLFPAYRIYRYSLADGMTIRV